MSQVLTVPTHFNDIGELSEGFLDRVEQDTLILYGPVPYEDGSEIDFVVLLADGTHALEGKGRVRAAVDGGAERVPETRYDVVVEALELDGRYEVVFERLVMARQAVSDHPPSEEDAPITQDFDVPPSEEAIAEEPVADEEPVDEAAFEGSVAEEEAADDAPEVEMEPSAEEVFSVPSEEVFSVPPDEVFSVPPEEVEGADEDHPEMSVKEEEMEMSLEEQVSEPPVGAAVPKPSMAAPPESPPAPRGLQLATPPEGLTRPSRAGDDEPIPTGEAVVDDELGTGLFEYEEGLPIPSRPPLPDLDPSRRVAAVEAQEIQEAQEVEDSEPPDATDDDYEEIRLSELAESAEEG